MWGMKLAMLVLGLLAMVPQSMQLRANHPLFSAIEKVNLEFGPFLGLVISSERDEITLKNSTLFTLHPTVAPFIISGRKFNVGRFNGVSAIYVLAGDPLANVGVTVELLTSTFFLSGLIGYGAAASVSSGVLISNVVVPSQVAYIGAWTWQSQKHPIRWVPSLVFGDYNLPKKGENSLVSAFNNEVPLYTILGTPEETNKTFWIDVHSEWLKIASGINFGVLPKVHIGPDIKLGSSDIIIYNEDYSSYLNSELGVTAVDTHSAAIITTAIGNNIPHIVFRGVSNRPNVSTNERLKRLAARNVLNTVAKFVEAAYATPFPNKYSII